MIVQLTLTVTLVFCVFLELRVRLWFGENQNSQSNQSMIAFFIDHSWRRGGMKLNVVLMPINRKSYQWIYLWFLRMYSIQDPINSNRGHCFDDVRFRYLNADWNWPWVCLRISFIAGHGHDISPILIIRMRWHNIEVSLIWWRILFYHWKPKTQHEYIVITALYASLVGSRIRW